MKVFRHFVAFGLVYFLALPTVGVAVDPYCFAPTFANTAKLPFGTTLGPWNDVTLTVSPLHTNQIFLGANNFSTGTLSQPAWAYSTNDGASWMDGWFPLFTSDGHTYPAGSDFEFYVSPQNVVRYTGTMFNPTDDSNALVVGKVKSFVPFTLSTPLAVAEEAAGSGNFLGNAQMAEETFPSKSFFDIFVEVDIPKLGTTQVEEFISTDSGLTWSSGKKIAPSLTKVKWYRIVPETGARNGLGVFLTESSGTADEIYFVESRDGGNTWNAAKKVASDTPPNFPAVGPYVNNPDFAWNPVTQKDKVVYSAAAGTNGSAIEVFYYDPVTGIASPPVTLNDTTTGNRAQASAAIDPATGQEYMLWWDNRHINPTQPLSSFQFLAAQKFKTAGSVNTPIDPISHPGSLLGPVNNFSRVVQAGGKAVYFPSIQKGIISPTQSTVVVTKLSETIADFSASLSAPASVTKGSLYTANVGVAGPSAVPFKLTFTIPTGAVFKAKGSSLSLSCTTPAVNSSGNVICTPTAKFSSPATIAVTLQATASSGSTLTLKNQVAGTWCDGTPIDNVVSKQESVK